jgi:hypothetical protein
MFKRDVTNETEAEDTARIKIRWERYQIKESGGSMQG